MAGSRTWQDEYTLLCERCGYVVEGLPADGACPECGKAIAESLPERRVGTPWQRRQTRSSLVHTWIVTLLKPARTLDRMRADEPATWLRAWSFLASAAIIAVGLLVFLGLVLSVDDGKFLDGWFINAVISALVAGCFIHVCLYLLVFIEQYGIRMIARNRRYRLRSDTCAAICSHGCVGWVIGALLGSISLIALAPFEARPMAALPWPWYLLPVAGMLAGFLFFETFAWLGLRRLKYANRVRPGGTPPPPERMARP